MLLLNKKKLLSDRKALGKWGEKRAQKFLKKHRMKTLACNFLCKTGEIDLVMADKGGSIVFVEVKTRTIEDVAKAEDSVTYGKRTRLIRAGRYFLETNEIENRPFRFDVIAITLDQNGNVDIKHYPNAFVP